MQRESQPGLFCPDSQGDIRKQWATYYIDNDMFDFDPYQFYMSFLQSTHPLMLTQYSLEEFSTLRTFKIPMFNMGFALRDTNRNCEIVALHNNDPSIRNIGHLLVQAAIRQGGNALDHFGSEKLNHLYGNLGFIEVHREPFNPLYDSEGVFRATYGELPVIYRVLHPY